MDMEAFKIKFADAVLETREDRGSPKGAPSGAIISVKPHTLHDLLRFCKEDSRFKMNMLLDVVAVDFIAQRPRFEVIYLLYSVELKHRLRVKVRIDDGVELPTAVDLWLSADWAEREVWDMFGIRFKGHPNLKRILMFEGFEGHPLRRDYPINRRQKIPEIEEIP
jgi:NADH-quinone oxidoreductase subunit C